MIIYPDSQNYYPEIFQRYKELSDEFNLEEYEKGDYEVILIYLNSNSGHIFKSKIEYTDSDITTISIADFYKIYSDRFLVSVSDEKADSIINLLGVSRNDGKANELIVKQLSYTYDLLSSEKIRLYLTGGELFYHKLDQLRCLLIELNKFNYYDNRSS